MPEDYDLLGCADYQMCIQEMKEEVVSQWTEIQHLYSCLESLVEPMDFFRLCENYKTEIAQSVFLFIACDYSKNNRQVAAKLLLLLYRKPLYKYLYNRQYFRELRDIIDKWNCLVEIFLRMLRIHAIEGGYGYSMIFKLIRSAIQKEQRYQADTSFRKMCNFNEHTFASVAREDSHFWDGEDAMHENNGYFALLKKKRGLRVSPRFNLTRIFLLPNHQLKPKSANSISTAPSASFLTKP